MLFILSPFDLLPCIGPDFKWNSSWVSFIWPFVSLIMYMVYYSPFFALLPLVLIRNQYEIESKLPLAIWLFVLCA